MRRWLTAAALMALMIPVALSVQPSRTGAAPAAAGAVVPGGFVDSPVGSMSQTTTVGSLSDGTVVVLTKSGTVRLARNGALSPTPALTIPASVICTDANERGLLGFATSAEFLVDHQVWLYYTVHDATAPGGCVNRVSRYSMNNGIIDPLSETILVDGIGSPGGNHNGGDVEIGEDGDLYIAVGDGGVNPRNAAQSSGGNQAAQDLSLLNGKILRVDRMTGAAIADNPLVGAANSADCRVRGNNPLTPTTPCREIYAWGLRNPYRFAFDRNSSSQHFFIDDVGLNTREEVDLGAKGANYGWPAREGVCPQARNPPCAASDPAAGYTEPITDYPHPLGEFITADAFVPNGFWPAAYDGGYLFADGGSGKIWLRDAAGNLDYNNPFATGAVGITDMAFVLENGSLALYYSAGGALRRISYAIPAATASGPLAFRAVPAGTRVYDTRGAGDVSTPVRAGATRYVRLPVDGSVTRAALVNITFVNARTAGFLTAWAGRAAQPFVSNVNTLPGEVVANASVVPLDASGGFNVYAYTSADIVVDVLGYFDNAPGAVAAGRFAPLTPNRLADTREAANAANVFGRVSGGSLPIVRVPVGGRGGVPAAGVSSVALSVTAIGGSGAGGGYVTASAGGAPFALSSNLNTNAPGDIRANLVVVPLGPDGTVDLHLFNIADVVVDVTGWFTATGQPASGGGRFVSMPPTRMVDTRENIGFSTLAGLRASSVTPPAGVPGNAAALAQNVTIANSSGPGFVTPFPAGGAVPFVSAGNATAAGQDRAVLALTKLGGPPATMAFYSYMRTDLVVDVAGYFTSG